MLVARGIIDVGPLSLGLDCSGIIRDVGAKVTDFKVGDRVMACSQDCFSSTVITSEKFCAILPNRMTFEEGATIPCVYATVLYSLVDVARIEIGQVSRSVPIRSIPKLSPSLPQFVKGSTRLTGI